MSQTETVDKIKTHTLCTVAISEKRAVHEIMCKNTVESERPQTTIRRMSFACWIAKATNTLSEYVVLIAFPLQQWLHERALTF